MATYLVVLMQFKLTLLRQTARSAIAAAFRANETNYQQANSVDKNK